MRSVSVVLPFPPTVNHYLGRRGHHSYLTPEARAFRAAVDAALIEANLMRFEMLTLPLRVTVHAFFPSKRGDLHNIEKVLCDTLQGRLFANDRQIVEGHWYRRTDRSAPRVHVTLEEIEIE